MTSIKSILTTKNSYLMMICSKYGLRHSLIKAVFQSKNKITPQVKVLRPKLETSDEAGKPSDRQAKPSPLEIFIGS